MKHKLYVFAIFHYCEKARWALDYLQVDYQLLYLSPISHYKKPNGLVCQDLVCRFWKLVKE
ncbi:MAG: glutathione S-transferase [Arenicella sp.]|jgi:glutathione S-transferase